MICASPPLVRWLMWLARVQGLAEQGPGVRVPAQAQLTSYRVPARAGPCWLLGIARVITLPSQNCSQV